MAFWRAISIRLGKPLRATAEHIMRALPGQVGLVYRFAARMGTLATLSIVDAIDRYKLLLALPLNVLFAGRGGATGALLLRHNHLLVALKLLLCRVVERSAQRGATGLLCGLVLLVLQGHCGGGHRCHHAATARPTARQTRTGTAIQNRILLKLPILLLEIWLLLINFL